VFTAHYSNAFALIWVGSIPSVGYIILRLHITYLHCKIELV